MFWALLGIGAGLGFFKGLAGAKANDQQFNDNLNALNQKQEDIATAKTQLSASYDNSKKLASAQTERKLAEYGIQQQLATDTRDRIFGQTANMAIDQDKLQQTQIAEVQIQASQAEGQAVQASATSGFRTGIDNNIVQTQKSASDRAISNAKAQLMATRTQTIYQMRNNYLSANEQINAFERAKKEAQYAFADAFGENGTETLKYKQQMELFDIENSRTQDDIDWMNTEGFKQKQWQNTLGFATSIFDGASQGVALASSFGWNPSWQGGGSSSATSDLKKSRQSYNTSRPNYNKSSVQNVRR